MKKGNVFIQSDTYSCGACCIESILSYYGGYVPHEVILRDTFTDASGTNAYNIVRALEKYGFNSQGIKVHISDIKSLHMPLIAHIVDQGYDHFVVVYKIGKKNITTMNPRIGYKIYNLKEFNNLFDNIVITAIPVQRIVKYDKYLTYYQLYKGMIKGKYKTLFSIFILNCVFIVLSLASSLYIKVIEQKNYIILAILFSIILLLKNIIYIIKDKVKRKLIINQDKKSNKDITKKIFDIDHRYISNKRSGEWLKRIIDMSLFTDMAINSVTDLVLNSVFLILCTVGLFIISKDLCLVAISSFFPLSLLFIMLNRKINYYESEYNDSLSLYNGELSEYTSSIETIKNIHKNEYFVEKLGATYANLKHNQFKLENCYLYFSVIKSFILDIYFIIIVCIGVSLIKSSIINLVDLFIVNSIYSLMTGALSSIANYIYGFINQNIPVRDICEIYNMSNKEPVVLSDSFKTLKIKKLSVSYDKKNNIIDNFYYKVHKGDKILILGPSGVGKSTLAKCISGLITDYNGYIYYNDINNVFYEKILYVGQNEALFTGTVRENITLNDDKDILDNICNICKVGNDIPLNKYVINKGENISKGEKARIILARALYLEPEVIIIDELLSNIEEDLENEILSSLLKMENITLLYITHRDKHKIFKKIINLERKDYIGIK